MNNLAVVYHCRLSGQAIPLDNCGQRQASIDPDFARTLFWHQLSVLNRCGLADRAKLFIGLNGVPEDAQFIRTAAPSCQLWHHGPESKSLLPTFCRMRQSALDNAADYYCFFHIKGVSHPGDSVATVWRQCMEEHVLWRWESCVADLDKGFDAAGCHWIVNPNPLPDSCRQWDGNHFFGGVFWWAKGEYLRSLPELPPQPTDRHEWYLPELWLGCGKPKIKDYHPHWPSLEGCKKSAGL